MSEFVSHSRDSGQGQWRNSYDVSLEDAPRSDFRGHEYQPRRYTPEDLQDAVRSQLTLRYILPWAASSIVEGLVNLTRSAIPQSI